MARRSQHSFLKRQKEIKRKETAAEKMARRQGKIERPKDEIEEEQEAIVTEEQEASSADE
jgi:type II secretory pathway component PulJ